MSSKLRLHNAMWAGLVGKGEGQGQEPPISLDRMLELTAAAEVDGKRFHGVDMFVYEPHINPYSLPDDIKRLADKIGRYDLKVGSLVAPVWPGTVGDSAMGNDEQQAMFLEAVRATCQLARTLKEHGIREYGIIRIDSATPFAAWKADPEFGTARIAETFDLAADIAEGEGEILGFEGESCWAGMHSIGAMVQLLELIKRPKSLGFQADLSHILTAMLCENSPDEAVLQAGYTEAEFWVAYEKVTDQLRPWTVDFHVAQNDGTIYGTGSHDKTGKHCLPNDPNGKLDIPRCSKHWLKGAAGRGIRHICWDGCMFPNAVLEDPRTWNDVLREMILVQEAVAEDVTEN